MSYTNATNVPVAQGLRKRTHVTFIFSLILHGRQMKLSWVHSTAIGGVTPALAAPMHYDLRGEISPHFWYSLHQMHCTQTNGKIIKIKYHPTS